MYTSFCHSSFFPSSLVNFIGIPAYWLSSIYKKKNKAISLKEGQLATFVSIDFRDKYHTVDVYLDREAKYLLPEIVHSPCADF